MSEHVTPDSKVQNQPATDGWQDFLDELNTADRDLAEKVRDNSHKCLAHGLASYLYLGKLAINVTKDGTTYGERVIPRLAAELGIQVYTVYEAKRTVEGLASGIEEHLLNRLSEPESSIHINKQHLVVLTQKKHLPSDEEERFEWQKEQLRKIVQQNLSAAQTRKLLSEGDGSIPDGESGDSSQTVAPAAGDEAPAAEEDAQTLTEAIGPMSRWIRNGSQRMKRWKEDVVRAVEKCPREVVSKQLDMLKGLERERKAVNDNMIVALTRAEEVLRERGDDNGGGAADDGGSVDDGGPGDS